jgi:hypothetical protein
MIDNNLLYQYIQNPKSPNFAFDLAESYYNQQQWSSALSFYLRVTEYSRDHQLIYESLLKSGLCFEKQGNRNTAVKGLYMNAISLLPKRPEAYFLLSRLYEYNKNHNESHMIANIGLSISNINLPELKTNIEYPGFYGLYFEKAVSLWWIGRIEESLNLFLELYHEKYGVLDDLHKRTVLYNIEFSYGKNWVQPFYYNYTKKLKRPFNDSYKIEKNYSQVYQDIFILTALKGKTEGKYLEIGANEPIHHSNTYLLESKFNWKGISLEIDPKLVINFNGVRKNTCYHKDATDINYSDLLDNQNWGNEYDYLQLDCEPPKNTFDALLLIPFDRYKFAIITYEHDYYVDDTKSYREKSRNHLKYYGYELVVNDIAPDHTSTFEDWWVHPDLVDRETINSLKQITNSINNATDYILEK